MANVTKSKAAKETDSTDGQNVFDMVFEAAKISNLTKKELRIYQKELNEMNIVRNEIRLRDRMIAERENALAERDKTIAEKDDALQKALARIAELERKAGLS